MKTDWYSTFLLCLVFVFTGCFRYELVKPEEISTTNDNTITIYTRSGKTIHYEKRQYEIIKVDTAFVLFGHGQILNEFKFPVQPYNSPLMLSNVEKIEVEKATTWMYILQALGTVSIVALCIFLIIGLSVPLFPGAH
ncbi:MAG: hypothetical protein L0Y80_03030 [Ignavibacteriae bacterium]|nr:hypothetical protein [Ignavibacteriota bacterium]